MTAVSAAAPSFTHPVEWWGPSGWVAPGELRSLGLERTWEHPGPVQQVLPAGDTVVVRSVEGGQAVLTGVDVATGAPRWSHSRSTEGGEPVESLADRAGAATLVSLTAGPAGEETTVVVDVASGDPRLLTHGEPTNLARLDDLCLVTTVTGTTAYDLATGGQLWTTQDPVDVLDGQLIQMTRAEGNAAPQAWRRLDPGTGAPTWELPAANYQDAIVLDGVLVLTTDVEGTADTVAAYRDGNELWRNTFEVGDHRPSLMPAGDDGVLVENSGDDVVFDLATGKRRWADQGASHQAVRVDGVPMLLRDAGDTGLARLSVTDPATGETGPEVELPGSLVPSGAGPLVVDGSTVALLELADPPAVGHLDLGGAAHAAAPVKHGLVMQPSEGGPLVGYR